SNQSISAYNALHSDLFHYTTTHDLYPLSLHDALPIYVQRRQVAQADARGLRLPPAGGARQPAAEDGRVPRARRPGDLRLGHAQRDRKSTRLNSSHVKISYAVFCLKKKRNITTIRNPIT